MKHTPTPWTQTNDMRGIGNVPVAGVESYGHGSIANCGTDGHANAAHIVTCVNGHAKLLDALTDCAQAMARYHEDGNETTVEEWDGALSRAQALLAKVPS